MLKFSRQHVDRTVFLNDQNCYWQSICSGEIVHRASDGRIGSRSHFWWALNFHDLFVTRPFLLDCSVTTFLKTMKKEYFPQKKNSVLDVMCTLWLCPCGVECVIVLASPWLYSFIQPLASPCVTMWWQTFPAQIDYDVAEWLDRERKMENWTTVQRSNEQGPSRTCGKKKEKYLEKLWWIAAEDDPLCGYHFPRRTKAGFSHAMVLMDNTQGWYENVDNDDGGSNIGANLGACLWIFAKAENNNWPPAFCEERRRRPLNDTIRIGSL